MLDAADDGPLAENPSQVVRRVSYLLSRSISSNMEDDIMAVRAILSPHVYLETL
jgi:hypothetical protein